MEKRLTNQDYWKSTLLYAGLSIVAVLLVFHETAISMVSIWWRTGTYAHGFFILPISLYLIWQKRHEVLMLLPKPSYGPLFFLAIAGLFWLFARMIDALVIQQLFLVIMILLVVLAHLGWAVYKRLLFPLLFLFFMVPAGDVLVPILMDFTADFTVEMVRLTGIPIYREGHFFSLPSGDWSVVEACSGIRYLIASVTLGFLYAYMTYTSLQKRIIFIILSILFPILANGLRAFMIVMIGHFSGMTLAVGVDHLIYGWLFFGLVMFLMFWLGSFWRDEPEQYEACALEKIEYQGESPRKIGLPQLILVLLISAIWPLKMSAILNEETLMAGAPVSLLAPGNSKLWKLSSRQLTAWEPKYIGYSEKIKTTYQLKKGSVELYLAYYSVQKQGEELIGWQNVLAPGGQQVSKEISRKKRVEKFSGKNFSVAESKLKLLKENRRFLVWRWNWISGEHTANDLEAKLLELTSRLAGKRGEAGVVVMTEYIDADEASIEQARAVLKSFIGDMLPEIEKTLKMAASS
jgi:exosortase A